MPMFQFHLAYNAPDYLGKANLQTRILLDIRFSINNLQTKILFVPKHETNNQAQND